MDKLKLKLKFKKFKMKKLTEYENAQLPFIQKWKEEEPGIITKGIGIVVKPISLLINKIVPQKAIMGALDFSNYVAEWLSDSKDIIRDGNVSGIKDLKTKDLELSDRLADSIHNWAIGAGTGEGAATGALGLPGLVIDIPAIITLSLRTIHKIGLCYGYETKEKGDKEFILGVLSASSANTVKEKVAAVTFLRNVEVTLATESWKKIAQSAAKNQLSKDGGIIAIRSLARQLGINITKRKALAAIPVIGAAIGGSVNGWFIKEVGWAARRAFQERWLVDNGKV